MTKTRATLRQHNNPIMWGLVLLAVIVFVPSMLFDRVFYRLDDVSVHSAPYGEDPVIGVTGQVLRPYYGSYSVTIRRVDPDGETGRLVCQGEPEAPFTYQASDYGHFERTLSWWMGGRDRLEACRSEGMGPGLYVAITCHKWLLPNEWVGASRCLRSNTFEITPPEETNK